MVKNTLACSSHRWSKTDEKELPIDRECLAVLWVIDNFTSYFPARPFTLTTDCSALNWLFTGQALSVKYRRWAFWLYVVRHRAPEAAGTKYHFADVLSRSYDNRTRGATVDDSFPGDSTTKGTYRGPSA